MTATLRALTGGLLLLTVPITAAGPREPVALIYQVSGEALRTAPGRSPGPLRLYDRLPAGATLEVSSGARVTLAFVTGKRYEISGPTRVTLGKGDLAVRSGGVQALATVPPFPLLAPISESENPGEAAGAVRIRSERITGLYPRYGSATLAGETLLRFRPIPGATTYRIEVQDGQGRILFQTGSESSPVKVPESVLRSGHHYIWTVRTLDRPGPVTQGEAEFVTLSEKAARAREEAWEILEIEQPVSLPLMAEIDHSLGLLLEARDELRTTLDEGTSDPTLREALAGIERQLEEDHEKD